ncbi:MAG: phage terminase large subunit, partial [Proteobacteria bacterium]|nr:phage terminase large subunit [Pseudomonadota bacterium]
NREEKAYDLIINIPPGMTKTIICSIVFPVWCWTKWHWMRFITGSYSSSLSLQSAEYSRDLIRSDRFKKVYPDLDIKEDKDSKGNYQVIKKVWRHAMNKLPANINGGNRYSTSVGGTLTGFHGDINIWDDPLNPKQAVSDKERETANNWVDLTLSTRKTDKRISVTIGIMQRLHQDDPSGHILAKKKAKVRHICLPGEIRNYEDKVQPPEMVKYYKDGLLDPNRMNWAVLEELEADLGQYGYAGQVGQNPTPPGGGMFKVDHFQMLRTILNPVNYVQTVRYWDKAGTAGGGAYTTGTKISRLNTNKIVIEDVKRGQWSSEERERIIKETAEIDGRNVTVIVEQEPGSGGKESAENTIRNLAGYVVLADRPTGDKVFRADPLSVQVNNGNVLLMQGEWNHDLIEEFRYFPFGTYKDIVDSCAAGFNYLMNKRMVKRIT